MSKYIMLFIQNSHQQQDKKKEKGNRAIQIKLNRPSDK